MLDKSLPFKEIYMRMEAADALKVPEPKLPEGYAFRLFENGDERHWAHIVTTTTGEFDSEEEALTYFEKEYQPRQELYRRCLFVTDPSGQPIGTATAWTHQNFLGRQPAFHWISVLPEHRDKGIGKALAAKVVRFFPELEPGLAIYLSTQTWSWKALGIFHDLGFYILDQSEVAVLDTNNEDGFVLMANPWQEALAILEPVLAPELMAAIRNNIH